MGSDLPLNTITVYPEGLKKRVSYNLFCSVLSSNIMAALLDKHIYYKIRTASLTSPLKPLFLFAKCFF